MGIDKLAIKDEIFNTISHKKSNYLQHSRTPSNKSLLDGVYMFISLDLSNSTLFKNRYPNYWWETVKTFYDEVRKKYKVDDISSAKYGFCVWKYVGDEVLLYKRIKNIECMYDDVKLSEEATTELINIIKNETINKLIENQVTPLRNCVQCISSSEDEKCNIYRERVAKEYKTAVKGLLKIKTTIWIADCCMQYRGKYNNMIYMNQKFDEDVLNGTIIDFLGPDIDEGFRLAKIAEPNRVIISPKLAYVLYNSNSEYNDSDRKKNI